MDAAVDTLTDCMGPTPGESAWQDLDVITFEGWVRANTVNEETVGVDRGGGVNFASYGSCPSSLPMMTTATIIIPPFVVAARLRRRPPPPATTRPPLLLTPRPCSEEHHALHVQGYDRAGAESGVIPIHGQVDEGLLVGW